MERPTKVNTMLAIAEVIAKRSTCKRNAVGVVITPTDMSTIVSMGYNGAPRFAINVCPSDPALPGGCGCVHAEANALIKAPYNQNSPLVLFTTLSPCENCARLIVNSRVEEVIFSRLYRDPKPGMLTLLHGRVRQFYVNGSVTHNFSLNIDDLDDPRFQR